MVDDKQAEAAIKTLLEWIGDDLNREGLKDTPKRIVNRYKKIFSGYRADLHEILNSPAINVNAKAKMGMIILPNINFMSFCEHHFLPMIGIINIAYFPAEKLAGIGTITKIINVFTHRLQIQENLNIEIAEAIKKYLNPKGLAVSIKAQHYCVDTSVSKAQSSEIYTYNFSGSFETNPELQNQFFNI